MNRAFVAAQVIGILIQAWGDAKFNQQESKTGLHSDALFGLRVTDLSKATKSLGLGEGSKLETMSGEVFTMGKDGVWSNSFKDELYQDKDGIHVKRQPREM